MKIVIAGVGYVGLVTGICLADFDNEIEFVDNDVKKIEKLKKGELPIYEPLLQDLMMKNRNRILFTNNKNAYKNAQMIFVAVGTPEKTDGSVDLKYVFEISNEIAQKVNNDCIIVMKSTVPVGTCKRVEEFIKKKLKKTINIDVVSNPEFLSQGTAVRDVFEASRIVLGVNSKRAEQKMKEIYDKYSQPYVITTRECAEMIKYASNSFLALKLSYINEIANLCEKVGANIDDVSKGMGLDTRIGDKFLKAGVGYGGSCLPKDTKALVNFAKKYNCRIRTIESAIQVNEQQILKLLEKSRKYYKCYKGKNVAILGATFKPDTDDMREAPSIINIKSLINEGANINLYDPVGEKNIYRIFENGVNYCQCIEDALKGADICFIFTEWNDIKTLNLDSFKKLMNKPIILDGRNCYLMDDVKKYDIIYESIGR